MARATSPRTRGVTFDTARTLALALDGVEEGTSYGTPAFKRKGKLLARLREDGETLVVRADLDARDLLVASEPDTFFFTEHYAAHPWVLVRLPRVARGALAALLEEAWRSEAPKKRSPAAIAVVKVKAKAEPAPALERAPRKPAEALAWLRSLCLGWPEVTEVTSHGRPTFAVRGKTFVMFLDNHHGDGRLALWCKAPPGAQGVLVGSEPGRFFVPPYVGHRGWIGARLEGGDEGGAIAACVEESYQMTAPRRARRE
jgi:hypothetical protein